MTWYNLLSIILMVSNILITIIFNKLTNKLNVTVILKISKILTNLSMSVECIYLLAIYYWITLDATAAVGGIESPSEYVYVIAEIWKSIVFLMFNLFICYKYIYPIIIKRNQ